MGTIVVQVSKRKWTTQAMHFACSMARNTQSPLVLLQLIATRSPYLLGAEYGVIPPSTRELEEIAGYAEIAEDYGVAITLRPMQYDSLTGALVQAAVHTKARIVYANYPAQVVSFWRHTQLWVLRRQLAALGCQLYTLDEGEQTQEWVPSVSLKAAK
jgi:hypothetical protein